MEIVVTNGVLSAEEKQHYADYIADKYPSVIIDKLYLTLDGDFVNIRVEPQKHILTKMGGTLISDPLTWNDAKRAEYFETIPNHIDI
ncbi:MAG: hypothetical protein IJA20_02955 [Methanocorpusculum sp.]|nr:hypothetical protein [Oscillospiraceae bacterium]MBQ3569615.1 hypothetical protein [Methanocorpusculum sp.]